MNASLPTLWLFDIDRCWGAILAAWMRRADYSVAEFTSVEEMLERGDRPDVVLVGLLSVTPESLVAVAQLSARSPVVVSLPDADSASMRQLFCAGAADVIPRIQNEVHLAGSIRQVSARAAQTRLRRWEAVPAL